MCAVHRRVALFLLRVRDHIDGGATRFGTRRKFAFPAEMSNRKRRQAYRPECKTVCNAVCAIPLDVIVHFTIAAGTCVCFHRISMHTRNKENVRIKIYDWLVLQVDNVFTRIYLITDLFDIENTRKKYTHGNV